MAVRNNSALNNEQCYPYPVEHATGDWRSDMIKLAKELGYSKKVRNAIKESTDEAQANRIMRDARLGKEDAAISGYKFLNY